MCVAFYVATTAMSTLCPRRSVSLINGTTPLAPLVAASTQILIVKYDENVTQGKLNLKLVRKVLAVSWRNMKRSGNTFLPAYRMKLHKVLLALSEKYLNLLCEKVIYLK